MAEIRYIDRRTKREAIEQVYGKLCIQILYGEGLVSRVLSLLLLPLFAHVPLLSRMYGALQKSRLSRWKIRPFIRKFQIDASEFADPVASFRSFNDFFIRCLKPSARPIADGSDVAILPADARYLVFPDLSTAGGLFVKGQMLSLSQLLRDEELTRRYTRGSLVIARLCPVDYHRFHFPCSGVPEVPRLLNGALFSVNPMALKRSIQILSENRRVMTQLRSKTFGTILYIEVGATYVGAIHQSFTPEEAYAKGDEKGYFSFGGSCILLLFEPQRIAFDQDLLEASQRRTEIRGLFGQPLGRALQPF